jgi:hypothetical protein
MDDSNRPVDDSDRPVEVTKTAARQGVRVHAMRQVLIYGTPGAMLALLVAGLLTR